MATAHIGETHPTSVRVEIADRGRLLHRRQRLAEAADVDFETAHDGLVIEL